METYNQALTTLSFTAGILAGLIIGLMINIIVQSDHRKQLKKPYAKN